MQCRIGLAVDVDDATDLSLQLAPARRVARGTLASVHFDAFSFDQTDRLDFQIDPRFSYTSSARYQNLFRHVGYDLPFATADGSGVIEGGPSSDGRRRLEVVARDAAGNEGRVQLELSVGAPPEVTALDAAGAVSGVVHAGGRAVARVELETSTDGGRTWRDAGVARPDPAGSFRADVARSAASDIVRARAVDSLGVASGPRSVGSGAAPDPKTSVVAEVLTHGSFSEVRIPAEAPFQAVTVRAAAETTAARNVRAHGRGARIDVGAADASSTRFVLVDPWGREIPVEAAVPAVASPGGTSRIASASAKTEVTFLPETVREPVAVVLREVAPPRNAPGKLVPLGPLVAVDVGAVPLSGDYEALLHPPPGEARAEHVGVFVQSGQEFQYIGGHEDAARGAWTVRTRTLLPFGLFEDRAAPVIGTPRFQARSGRECFVFHVTEQGSGLDCDGVEVLLNGSPIANELDEERGEVCAYPARPEKRGASGQLEIRVTDRCGNTSRRTETVRLP